MTEIVTYAPNIRFYGELGILNIVFFQLLYIRLEYEFPICITFIHSMLYTGFQIFCHISRYRQTNSIEIKGDCIQNGINWFTLELYQVNSIHIIDNVGYQTPILII